MILAIVYKIIMQENVKGIAVILRKVNLQKNVEKSEKYMITSCLLHG